MRKILNLYEKKNFQKSLLNQKEERRMILID